MTGQTSQTSGQPDPTDAPALISELLRRATRLISSEIALAKREMAQKVSRAAGGLMMIAFAAFLAIAALNVLTAAAVAALAEAGLSVSVSSVIVAAVVFAGAVGLFALGKSRIDPTNLTPRKTIKSVQQDIETMKGNANAG